MALIPGPNNSMITELPPVTSSSSPYFPSLLTDAPAGGTASIWKMGVTGSATVALVTTKYVSVEIGGIVYKLGLVT